MSRKRWYVGVKGTRYEAFRAAEAPTQATHGAQYGAVIGPFRTRRGAEYMAKFGQGNPHLQCVSDAEYFAARAQGQTELCRDAIKHLTWHAPH